MFSQKYLFEVIFSSVKIATQHTSSAQSSFISFVLETSKAEQFNLTIETAIMCAEMDTASESGAWFRVETQPHYGSASADISIYIIGLSG